MDTLPIPFETRLVVFIFRENAPQTKNSGDSPSSSLSPSLWSSKNPASANVCVWLSVWSKRNDIAVLIIT